jgi:hypothetical protein
VSAECVGELDRHMAEAAEANDADFLAWAHVRVRERRIGRAARLLTCPYLRLFFGCFPKIAVRFRNQGRQVRLINFDSVNMR